MAGFNLGDIIVTIKAKTEDLQRGLNDIGNMAEKTKSFGQSMSDSLAAAADGSKKFALGIAAAGTAAVAFGVISVKAFSDSQNRIAQTNAVLKSTGQIAGVTADEVTKLATALEKTTKFSDEDVRSVENLLLTFTSIGKDIFPQATKTVLDMATALGEDTSSASIQLGKALQDPVLGVTALRRVGVNFNSAQQEVIKNLVDTGKSAQAQQLIMKELNREFGGSAEAAGGTFAGSLAKLKNQLNNVEEAVGGMIVKAVVPFIQKALDWFNSVGGVDGVMKRLGDTLKKIQPFLPAIIGLIIGGLIPAFVAWGISIWTALAPLLPFMAAGAALGVLIDWLVGKLGGWDKAWQDIIKVFHLVADPIITVLKPAFTSLWDTIEKQLMPVLQKVWSFLEPVLKPVLIAIAALIVGPLVAAVVAFVAALWVIMNVLNVLIQVGTFAWNTIVAVVSLAWRTMINIFSPAIGWFAGIWNGIINAARSAFGGLGSVFQGAWDNMKFGFKAALNWIIDQANTMINGYNSTIGRIPGTPHIANLARFARGTENFAGGGAVVGEEGPELGLFPSGTKIVPANLTANLVDNLMNVGDMLKTFMSGGINNFLTANQAAAPQSGGQGSKGDRTLNINGDIHIDSPQDADYFLTKLQRGLELYPKGIIPA